MKSFCYKFLDQKNRFLSLALGEFYALSLIEAPDWGWGGEWNSVWLMNALGKQFLNCVEARLNESQVGPFLGVWEVKQFVFALYQFFYSFNLISSPSSSIIKSSVLYIFIKHLFWTLICISDNITKCMHFKYSLYNCD